MARSYVQCTSAANLSFLHKKTRTTETTNFCIIFFQKKNHFFLGPRWNSLREDTTKLCPRSTTSPSMKTSSTAGCFCCINTFWTSNRDYSEESNPHHFNTKSIHYIRRAYNSVPTVQKYQTLRTTAPNWIITTSCKKSGTANSKMRPWQNSSTPVMSWKL